MKIKSKLRIGVGMLLLLVIILVAVGTYYINILKSQTENILVDNYTTLEYSRNMLMALDEKLTHNFEINLKKQQNNITEIGEKVVTDQLVSHYHQFIKKPDDNNSAVLVRKDISNIMTMNIQAIARKTNMAETSVNDAHFWIAISGIMCFLIAFSLFVNLPGTISNPIKELSESIKQIANKNYEQRVHFESHDEFGDLARSFNSMAEKLEEYNNSNLYELLYEKKRIDTLINNMDEPVIGMDENKKILFANNQALNILNLNKEGIIGKIATDVAMNNDLMRSLVKDIFTPNPIENASKPSSIKIFTNNKESFYEKEVINIGINATGEKELIHIGHVIVLKNITSFKELDFAKTNFIATVSHELKTPISSIKMSIQLLENEYKGRMSDDQNQLISSIKDDSNRLLKITGELLNMTQIETGNIQLNIQQSNPNTILNYAIDAVKTQADQRQIEIKLEIEENLPNIKADNDKTAWVLINFLTNAIRFSAEQSAIKIKIILKQKFVAFFVIDEGKGIDERYKAKIFDKYYQVPSSNKTGTGLGLAISKEFIEAQNGAIGVESEIGLGSTFYFKLPVG